MGQKQPPTGLSTLNVVHRNTKWQCLEQLPLCQLSLEAHGPNLLRSHKATNRA
jgi:hypothetical protein